MTREEEEELLAAVTDIRRMLEAMCLEENSFDCYNNACPHHDEMWTNNCSKYTHPQICKDGKW